MPVVDLCQTRKLRATPLVLAHRSSAVPLGRTVLQFDLAGVEAAALLERQRVVHGQELGLHPFDQLDQLDLVIDAIREVYVQSK